MKLGKHTTKICLTAIALFFLSFTFALAQGSVFNPYDMLWTFVNNVFGWMFAASGSLLNAAITVYVVGFGNQFITGGVGAAVDTAWVIVRDIFNLTFIFGLIWIGFKMILNSDDANTRRWLVNLIMAALLVNFSLFITKFIVDFTNLLATQIVLAGFPNTPSGAPDVVTLFMQQMGATSVWDGNWINDAPDDNYMVIFGAAFVFIIGAFVFLAGALMIYIRFIALCLYMIFSPLMFLGWVFPNMAGVTSKYWRGFLGRAFFAPVYILLLYFAAAVMVTFGTTVGGGSTFASAFAGGSGGWQSSGTQILVPFILVIGFLISAIVVANKLGADGAGVAMNMMTSARNQVQNKVKQTTYRYAGGAARGAGRVAAQPYEYGKRRTSYALGSGLERQINRMQQSNSKALRTIARSTSVDSGVRGASQSLKNQKAGLFTQQTIEEQKNASNKINEQANRSKEAVDILADLSKDLTAIKGKYGLSTDAEAKKKLAELNAEFQKKVKKMSPEEVLQLPNGSLKNLNAKLPPAEAERKKKEREALMSAMSKEQFKTFAESGRYNSEEIKAMKDSRADGTFNPLVDAIDETSATVTELNEAMENLGRNVSSMSNEEIGDAKIDAIARPEVAANFTQRQMDHLRDNKTPDEYKQIEKARNDGLARIARTGSLSSKTSASTKDPSFQNKQRQNLFGNGMAASGNLPVEVFTTPDMVPFIAPRALEERLKNGVSDTELANIKQNIDNYITHMPTGTPAERASKDRLVTTWKKWSDKSDYGAWLDLDSV